jgi:hypothetical protein
MSFGFSVGDFIAVAGLAERLYREVYLVARGGPSEISELCKELSSMSSALGVLKLEVQDPNSVLVQGGPARKTAITDMLGNVKGVPEQLEVYVKKHGLIADDTAKRSKFQRGLDKLRFSKDAGSINGLRAKLNYQCNILHLLMTSIGNSSLKRLQAENKIMNQNIQLIRDLLQRAPVQQVTSDSGMLPPPSMTGLDDDEVQTQLTQRYLSEAERDYTWMEIPLASWIDLGQRWLEGGCFWSNRFTYLVAIKAETEWIKTAGACSITSLIKASWIANDVIRQHPQRPYVTSGQRQLPITTLAKGVKDELQKLKDRGGSIPSIHEAMEGDKAGILDAPPEGEGAKTKELSQLSEDAFLELSSRGTCLYEDSGILRCLHVHADEETRKFLKLEDDQMTCRACLFLDQARRRLYLTVQTAGISTVLLGM